MNEHNLKRKVLYTLITGLVVCVGAFAVGITFQFSAFLYQSGLCHNLFVDVLLPCYDYPDIKLMILSAGLSVLLLFGIVYLYSRRAVAIILATLYSAFLFLLFVFRFFLPTGYAGTGDPNFIPFKTIAVYLSGLSASVLTQAGEPLWGIAWDNLAHNVWPFAVLGAMLLFTTKRPLRTGAVVVVALFIGTMVEGMQALFALGIFDIDDIVLNALGVALGYLLTATIIKYIRNMKRQPT